MKNHNYQIITNRLAVTLFIFSIIRFYKIKFEIDEVLEIGSKCHDNLSELKKLNKKYEIEVESKSRKEYSSVPPGESRSEIDREGQNTQEYRQKLIEKYCAKPENQFITKKDEFWMAINHKKKISLCDTAEPQIVSLHEMVIERDVEMSVLDFKKKLHEEAVNLFKNRNDFQFDKVWNDNFLPRRRRGAEEIDESTGNWVRVVMNPHESIEGLKK